MRHAAAFAMAVLLAAIGAEQSFAAPASARDRCLRALVPLAAGEIADLRTFETTPCSGDAMAPAFRYDAAAQSVRVARSVAAGEVVQQYSNFDRSAVAPRARLHLVVLAGGVRIERDVDALQAARPGQRLFVRTNDGAVLSVTYGGAEQ